MNAIETIQASYQLTMAFYLGLAAVTLLFFILELKHIFAPLPRLLGVPAEGPEKPAPLSISPIRPQPSFGSFTQTQRLPAAAA